MLSLQSGTNSCTEIGSGFTLYVCTYGIATFLSCVYICMDILNHREHKRLHQKYEKTIHNPSQTGQIFQMIIDLAFIVMPIAKSSIKMKVMQ